MEVMLFSLVSLSGIKSPEKEDKIIFPMTTTIKNEGQSFSLYQAIIIFICSKLLKF